MARIITFSLVFVSSLMCWSQDRSKLDEKYGFQDIRLGSDPKSYPGLKYKKSQEHEVAPSIDVYVAEKGFYESIGDVEIKSLEVWSFRDKIFRISILTEKDLQLFPGLERAFGKAGYEIASDSYVWKTDEVKLVFRAYSRSKLQMVYSSYLIGDWVRQSENEEIKDIAEDF